MATLLIEKNSLNVWTHTPSDFQPYILTQFYAKSNGDIFIVFEFSGVQRGSYHYSDISIKDGANPLETGFTSIKQVMLRLEELKYVGFEFDGDFIAAEVISSDPSNALIEGTDGKLFVPEVSGEVITTNTNITSSNLTTQDVAGFVAYINGLVSSFSVAANEIRTYTVTDTGQKFEILLRGRSFGGSEPDILTTDVFEVEPIIWTNKTKEAKWTVTGATTLTAEGGGQIYPVLYTGSKVAYVALSYANTLLASVPRVVYRSGSGAGSSCGIKTGSGSVYPFSTSTGYSIRMVFDTSDLAAVSTSRISCGVISSAADIGNVNPSSLLNCILVGNDTGDTNLWLMHNDGSGVCTRTDLGADFPHNTVNTFYELFLEFMPNSTVCHWILNRYQNTPILNTPAFTAKGVISTNFPSAAALPLAWFAHRDNGATASAVEISVSHVNSKYFY